jgi:cell division protein FtsL
MHNPSLVPTNRFLIPQRDQRWPHVLSLLLSVSILVVLVLGLVGWPRLRSTSIHYELIRLRAEVSELEHRQRLLHLELERERSPERLADRARSIGLQEPAPPGMAAPGAQETGP